MRQQVKCGTFIDPTYRRRISGCGTKAEMKLHKPNNDKSDNNESNDNQLDNKLNDDKLADLFEKVEKINDNEPITFFEILTACYFYKAAWPLLTIDVMQV